MLVERTNNIKIGDPQHEDTRIGAMMHQTQADKVMYYIDSAQEQVSLFAFVSF